MNLLLAVAGLLELDRRDKSDRLQEAVVGEPPDPFERGELDIFDAPPRPEGWNRPEVPERVRREDIALP